MLSVFCPLRAVAALMLAVPLVSACAESQGSPLVAAALPSSALRARPTTITLPPEGVLPDGAATIAVAESRGDASSGAPSNNAADALLGGAAVAQGESSADTVARMILVPRARSCYAALAKREPQARGRVILALDVRGDGSIAATTAAIASGLPNDTVGCIEGAAKNVMFPPPGGRGAHVSVPMTFAPEGDRAAPEAADAAAEGTVVPIVRDCYAQAREAGGKGEIEIVVRVGDRGAPLDVRGARDESVGGVVAQCASEKLRAARFEALAGRELYVPITLRHL